MSDTTLRTIEFDVGAVVTFKPYEFALRAIVRKVLPNHWGCGRVVYHLTDEGMDKRRRSVITYTTGDCIMESAHYKPCDTALLPERYDR